MSWETSFDYKKIRLSDRAYKHFFIAQNCVKMSGKREMQDFFEFLLSNKSSEGFTSDLGNYVNDAKHNTRWREQYMTWERMQAYARDEGIQTGKIEAAENALKLGLSVEQVMQITGLSLEKILELQKQL